MAEVTRGQRYLYLDYLRLGVLRTKAAEKAGLVYRDVVFLRRHEKAFATEEQAALEIGEEQRLDRVRTEIWRRGVEGIAKPVFYKGERVATVKEYSDQVLLREASKLDPGYNDRRPPEAAPGGVQIVIAGMLEPRVQVREVEAGAEGGVVEELPSSSPPAALPP